MLKSYKDLSRWYEALEPEPGARPVTPHAPFDDDGPARYPHYIREEDPEAERVKAEVPPDLPSRRAEFTGGWSDWVDGRAPGPDDDYAEPRDGDLVRFPWPDEDDYAPGAAPASAKDLRKAARERRRSRRGRVIAVLIVAVVLLAAAAAGVMYLLRAGQGAATGTPATMQFTAGSNHSSPAPGLLPGACPTERTGGTLRSAEAGGTGSGPDAVLAFQHAYYVARSGEQVRQVVAPDANVAPAPLIQRGIDSIPVGTTHCVRIATLAEGKYSVEVTEYRPGGVPATYKQTVTTAVIGGRTLITGIAAG
ncbi:hypothetical protein [Nocardia sp. NPDC052566]|uniref:hypothetical protein n=1 Tax=Nocardia sp. NPDC052566 TaxID=3364330 RepID=UPI0037C94A83